MFSCVVLMAVRRLSETSSANLGSTDLTQSSWFVLNSCLKGNIMHRNISKNGNGVPGQVQ